MCCFRDIRFEPESSVFYFRQVPLIEDAKVVEILEVLG